TDAPKTALQPQTLCWAIRGGLRIENQSLYHPMTIRKVLPRTLSGCGDVFLIASPLTRPDNRDRSLERADRRRLSGHAVGWPAFFLMSILRSAKERNRRTEWLFRDIAQFVDSGGQGELALAGELSSMVP